MKLYAALALFAAGLILLVKGGDWFVAAAADIARALGIPAFIVGATVVSLATTMPELLVSLTAAAAGKTDMAVGNAVGSVTANTGLIMALAMVLSPAAMPRRAYAAPCLLLTAAAGVLHLGTRDGYLKLWACLALGVIFAAFLRQNAAAARWSRQEASGTGERDITGRDLGLFLLGAAGVAVGSRLLVTGGSAIAEGLGVSERTVAVTMVAVGTSLPELVTALTAIRKGEGALSAGNIIGANIIDLSLILPASSAVSGRLLPVGAASIRLDMPVCLFVTLLAVLPGLARQRTERLQGAALLLVYGWYIFTTV